MIEFIAEYYQVIGAVAFMICAVGINYILCKFAPKGEEIRLDEGEA